MPSSKPIYPISILALAAFILILVSSCKHEPLLPEKEISFSRDVMPIIAGNCGQSGCHGAVDYDEFPLSNYEEVMSNGKVEAGNANDSELYEVITETDEDKRMPPPPRSPLTQEQIQTIFIWIEQGAPNN